MLEVHQVSLGRDFARALDPVLLAKDVGIIPDEVQVELLTTPARKVLVNCCRQWGKSSITALIALHEALYQSPAVIILVSPSQPQSTELFKKVHDFWSKLPGAPEAHQESDPAPACERLANCEPPRQRANHTRLFRLHASDHG